VSVPLAASFPDWLTAIGGFGAFLATAVLAFIATKQMKSLGQQIDASVEQGRAVREAARAQLQPIVFAHSTGPYVRGPDDRLSLAEGQIAFPFYLANEGDGIALNIRHGVEIDGQDSEFTGGEFRALRTGEKAPPVDPVSGQVMEGRPLTIVKAEHELQPGWEVRPRWYWARFENVFGEPFETRSSNDPRESPLFIRLPPRESHRREAFRLYRLRRPDWRERAPDGD
jgi:hypothetical protein